MELKMLLEIKIMTNYSPYSAPGIDTDVLEAIEEEKKPKVVYNLYL